MRTNTTHKSRRSSVVSEGNSVMTTVQNSTSLNMHTTMPDRRQAFGMERTVEAAALSVNTPIHTRQMADRKRPRSPMNRIKPIHTMC